MYGAYAVVMKKRVGNEDRVNMPLFFGFVGLFNLVSLWPGFVVLHFTGIETFELPPTGKIWTVILVGFQDSLSIPFADDEIAELCHFFCERLLLGIRNAPHNTPDRVCRPVTDNTHVTGRADTDQLAIGESAILGWRSCCGTVIHFHQP